MRLKPDKIEQLARTIARSLAENKDLKLNETEEHVMVLIRNVITADLKLEDEIEEDARKLLDQHKTEIDRKGAQYDKLLQKAKAQLAKDRKMVL